MDVGAGDSPLYQSIINTSRLSRAYFLNQFWLKVIEVFYFVTVSSFCLRSVPMEFQAVYL